MKRYFPMLMAATCSVLISEAGAYVLNGLRWPDPTATMYPGFTLNGATTSASGTSWNAAFNQAITIWNNAQVSFDLVSSTPGSDPCAGVDSDGDGLIDFPSDGIRNGAGFNSFDCYDPFGDGTLAVTISYYFTDKPDEVVEADIVFNSNEDWDVYSGTLGVGPTDFRRVAVHELGHVMGLGHEETVTAIMHPYVSNLEVPQADDITGLAAIYGGQTDVDPIAMSIEEPFNGSVQSGVSTVRGWIVSQFGITSAELFLDGISKGQLVVGGKRVDVCTKHAAYPDCATSGFAFAQAWGNLAAGNHTYRIDAKDSLNNTLSRSVTFSVTRYDDPYVADSSLVTLSGATVTKSGEDILVNGLSHNGKAYDLRMRWRKQTQDFEPVQIIKK